MANPWAAAAYGAPTQFVDPGDVHEFKPSRIVSYYLNVDGFQLEFDPLIDSSRVLDPGPLRVDYPHAGILNTNAFLIRYPSTATNPNRARSRWTYYHFLSEFSASFEVEADSQAEKQTLSLSGPLKACSRTVSVAYLNDYWDEVRGGRNVYLDRLHLRNAVGRIISRHELEELGPSGDCNRATGDHYAMWCSGSIEVTIDIPTSGDHTVEIVVWAEQAGEDLPKLRVTVNSDAKTSVGAAIIRNKLVELHDKLLGVQVAPDSPDVETAYRLFVDVWQRNLRSQDMEVNFRWLCDWEGDLFYAPFAGNVAFFEKYYQRMLVVNGVDAQTNSHTVGIVHN